MASPISCTMASNRWVSTETVMGSIMAASHEPAADADFGLERAMHGALLRDLEQSGPLRLVQRPGEGDFVLDPVEPPFPGLALRAVGGVDLRVLKSNLHAVQGPLLASRVQRDGHGRSRPQRDQQVIIGRWPGVGPAGRFRLVGREVMPVHDHVLAESGCATTHHHERHVLSSPSGGDLLGWSQERDERSMTGGRLPGRSDEADAHLTLAGEVRDERSGAVLRDAEPLAELGGAHRAVLAEGAASLPTHRLAMARG